MNLIEIILNYVIVPVFAVIWMVVSPIIKFAKAVIAHAYECAVKYFGKMVFRLSLLVATLLISANLMQ